MRIAEVVQQGLLIARGATSDETVTVAGQVVSAYREAGRLVFWMLNDGSAEVQVALTPQRLGEAGFEVACQVEAGQHVQAAGALSRSRRGMLTVLATAVESARHEGHVHAKFA